MGPLASWGGVLVNRGVRESRLFGLVVLLLLLAVMLPVEWAKAVAATPQLMIDTQVIAYETDWVQGDVNIPVLRGLGNLDLQEKLNERWSEEITSFVDEIKEAAQDFSEEFGEELAHWLPFQVGVDYRVAYLDEGLASISIVYYRYTGGAHGFSYHEGTNVDLSTGKDLILADLFVEGYDYRQVIEDEVVGQIEADPVNYFEEDWRDQKIARDHDFCLTPEGLVIYYGLYEIAPYCSGIPEFTIPFANLWEGLRPSIQVLVGKE